MRAMAKSSVEYAASTNSAPMTIRSMGLSLPTGLNAKVDIGSYVPRDANGPGGGARAANLGGLPPAWGVNLGDDRRR
jgi:hypothetical protein